VYVVVIDGLCRVARLPEFIRNLSRVRCRVEMVGPFGTTAAAGSITTSLSRNCGA
jgi:hypothetical protein